MLDVLVMIGSSGASKVYDFQYIASCECFIPSVSGKSVSTTCVMSTAKKSF